MNQSNDKKNNIINAAIEIFSQKGYEKGTVAEIAAKADIAKGSFYHYYNSKEEIIYDLFAMYLENYISNWKNIIAQDYAPDKKVKLLIEQTFEDLMNMENEDNLTNMVLIFEIMFMLFRKSLKNSNNNEIDKIFEKYYDILLPVYHEGQQQGLFRKNIEPKYAAYLIFGMIDGFSLHFIIQKNKYDLEKSKKYLTDLILHGLMKK